MALNQFFYQFRSGHQGKILLHTKKTRQRYIAWGPNKDSDEVQKRWCFHPDIKLKLTSGNSDLSTQCSVFRLDLIFTQHKQHALPRHAITITKLKLRNKRFLCWILLSLDCRALINMYIDSKRTCTCIYAKKRQCVAHSRPEQLMTKTRRCSTGVALMALLLSGTYGFSLHRP